MLTFLYWAISATQSKPPFYEYLKEITHDSLLHAIKHIDCIYLINLEERPEKLKNSILELEPYHILPLRVCAVNGWTLPKEAYNRLGITYQSYMKKNIKGVCYLPENNYKPHHEFISGLGRCYYHDKMSKGAIGITLSHLSVLKDAYMRGYQRIWVMEDDIQVLKNPHQISEMIELLETIPELKNWDILFTDKSTKNRHGTPISCSSSLPMPHFTPSSQERFKTRVYFEKFILTGARMGAYSMILKRSGIKKILEFYECYGIFLPYDMTYYLPEDIKIISTREDIVSSHPKSLSDNLFPHYKENE